MSREFRFVVPGICCRGDVFKYRAFFRKRFLNTYPRCIYCEKELAWSSATIDHVVPLGKGGRDSWKNYVLACEPCNTFKGDKCITEAGMQMMFSPLTWWSNWRRIHDEPVQAVEGRRLKRAR